jgi:alkylation response protein AidB-like acyl-CoA dehydrogenase
VTAATTVLGTARRLAEEVLFPAAAAVDAADLIPATHLDLLAAEGFYGLAGPVEAGGLGAALDTGLAVIETLAGGCLATTFVWLQHQGAVRAVAASTTPGVRERWLRPLCEGRRRAGVALAGTLPGPPRLVATPVEGGYLLDGESPWLTGWGLIDTLHVAARGPADTLVWALTDPVVSDTLTVRPLRMVAVNASATVTAWFVRHFVPAEAVTGTLPFAQWPARDAAGLRVNGSLALGVAGRCCRLIGSSPLDAELASRRAGLDAATVETMPAARAAATELASRAAAALVVTRGSRSILAGEHGQRLAREALFLLVFASRPAIRDCLVARLTGSQA